MENAKPTPAPWPIKKHYDDENYYCRIIEVGPAQIRFTHGYNLETDAATLAEAEANAKLISVSNELLELAKIAERQLRREFLDLAEKYAGTRFENDPAYQGVKQRYEDAKAIIATATGGN